MLQAVTFDFWGTLYQNASARDERLHLLEEVLFLGVSHRQDGRPLADAVFEEYGELEELLEGLDGMAG